MVIGMPKEIKNNEYRCAAVPGTVSELVRNGHKVLVESGTGFGSSIADEAFERAGAIVSDRDTVYRECELLYKVKEILPPEYRYLRKGMTIFTYLHSNAHREMTDALLKSGCTGIAYEDITDDTGAFPLLRPMSELAGKGGFFMACQYMQSVNGGSGLMLTRVSGIRTPEIAIIGAGNAGFGVAELAAGPGQPGDDPGRLGRAHGGRQVPASLQRGVSLFEQGKSPALPRTLRCPVQLHTLAEDPQGPSGDPGDAQKDETLFHDRRRGLRRRRGDRNLPLHLP